MKTGFHLIAVMIVLWSTWIDAAPVEDWHAFRPGRATTLADHSTSSPVFGWPTDTSSSAFLIGYFKALTLTNLGDRITLKFGVSFTDPSGMTNNDDQFRFALYDRNDQPIIKEVNLTTAGMRGHTDNWFGYWFGVDSSQPGAMGTIRKRTMSNVHPIANLGTTLIGTPTGTPVIFVSSTQPEGGPLYSGEMSIERIPKGVALGGFFGGNGTTNYFAAVDEQALATKYSAVGFLNGASSNCDQINFMDVQVNYVVSNALKIVNDPSSVTAAVGDRAEFRVDWEGTGLVPAIEWQENGAVIVGATNRVLIIPITNGSQNNNVYRATVKNVFGDSATSSEAVLTVTR